MKRLLTICAVGGIILSGGAALGQGDWPMFNRDLLNSGVADPSLAGVSDPIEKWSYTTDNSIGPGNPVIGDIDGDGVMEILVPTANFRGTGGIYALNADGTLRWKYQTGDYGTYATPPLADIDGDGKLETIFPSYGGKIVAVDEDGTEVWSVDKGSGGTRSVIADVTGDAALEVVAGAAGKTFLLNASDGTQIWQAGFGMISEPAIADVDGDGKLEVVFGAAGTRAVVALNAEDGTAVWASPAASQDFQGNSAIVGDINGDGHPDVVAGARDKKLYLFSGADGTKLWDYTLVGRCFSAGVADFDGDGHDDVATTATKGDGVESYVYLLDVKDQMLLWQHNIIGKQYYTTERSPSIADINGDGTPDLVISGLCQKLYALSGLDGSEIWTMDTSDPSAGVPAIGDLDGDGLTDIVVSAGSHVAAFTQVPPPVPSYACIGFDPPMDKGPVKVKKNRVLPLKAELVDADGYPVTNTDVIAPPLIQVMFDSGTGGDAVDVTDDALAAGHGTDGNQFEFSDGKWRFNLKTKDYTASGTYTVAMVSGDGSEYIIDPSCEAVFVIE